MHAEFDQLVIRPMTVADLDELMVIENYSFPTPWKRAMYEQDLATNRLSRFYVLKSLENAELLAYIGSWFIYEEAHVGTIAVRNDCRGRQFAEQMLAYTALQALNEGLEYIILEVRVSNQPARRLYERLGFKQVGIRKMYYSDTGEDALLLVKQDIRQLAGLLKVNEG